VVVTAAVTLGVRVAVGVDRVGVRVLDGAGVAVVVLVGVRVAVGVQLVAPTAPTASIKPSPERASRPGDSMSLVVERITARSCGGVSPELACRSSAATAAACATAAEAPEKLGKVSASKALSTPKKLVFVPSGAATSGLNRLTGAAGSGLPLPVKKNGRLPPQ
jgi:hypothetical protein